MVKNSGYHKFTIEIEYDPKDTDIEFAKFVIKAAMEEAHDTDPCKADWCWRMLQDGEIVKL